MKKRLANFIVFSVLISLLTLVQIESSAAAMMYSFTTAGATGATGPTQTQINSAYAGTPLAGLVTINTQGIQEWVVPTTGDYWIELAGASGGYTPSALGGKGRTIKIKVGLVAGNVLKILVGQEGGRLYFSTGYAAGGGGGTYIYNSTTSSFIAVAGGGGGAAQGNSSYVSTQPGVDASAYNVTSGTAGSSYSGSWQAGQAGGTNGGAGIASSGGGAGAGVNGNGAKGTYGGYGGSSFSNGGVGGAHNPGATATVNVSGGFGGGAGAGTYPGYEADSGGGGGYSGGGGGGTRVGAGGGGGNYYTGTYVSSGSNTGNGYVNIQLAVLPTVSLAVSGGASQATKGLSISLIATVDDTVRVTFFADGKRIPGCISLSAVAGPITCNWKPARKGNITLYSEIYQNGAFISRSQSQKLLIGMRNTYR